MTTTLPDTLLALRRVLCGAESMAAIDDGPVDIVFAAVAPDGLTDEHLRLRACRDHGSARATRRSAPAQGGAA